MTPEKFYNEPFVSDKEIWDKYYISAKSLPNKITIEEGKDLDLGEINIFIQEKPLENTPRLRNVKKSKEEVNNILIPTDLTIDISI